ncbi:hypothetical protein HC031_31180 [Planosporangium thailandense]|uniref:Uncharacterized protein n=1 Tax=Planosporangium thailandense TaxID=765197 RepID=A0ABX0Y731_9ACTN|nr:hypothetical protein [Planosporangium thailandense]NJC74143.1 hypothetical protein [Planosporangium thailandense]
MNPLMHLTPMGPQSRASVAHAFLSVFMLGVFQTVFDHLGLLPALLATTAMGGVAAILFRWLLSEDAPRPPAA